MFLSFVVAFLPGMNLPLVYSAGVCIQIVVARGLLKPPSRLSEPALTIVCWGGPQRNAASCSGGGPLAN